MKKIINKLEQNLGFKITKIELYTNAITHKSADKINNYEKLEFLGDRVLGLCISKKLLEIFPNEKEGILDKKLASLVNKNKCFEVGMHLKLDNIIKIGNLRIKKQAIEKKIISDSCEALIGAIYLDKGFDYVSNFVLNLWKHHINKSDITILDSKTELQEYSLKSYKKLPVYNVINLKGPRHNPTFKISVSITGSKQFYGFGKSKQQAELDAAKNLLKSLTIK